MDKDTQARLIRAAIESIPGVLMMLAGMFVGFMAGWDLRPQYDKKKRARSRERRQKEHGEQHAERE
jgi:hypothetical protein